jgi:hypothetical protein
LENQKQEDFDDTEGCTYYDDPVADEYEENVSKFFIFSMDFMGLHLIANLEEDTNSFVDDYNKLLLWYPSEKDCGGWEFLYESWKNYFNVYTNIDPYYFCVSNAGTCSSTLNGINTFIPNKDYTYFYYE